MKFPNMHYTITQILLICDEFYIHLPPCKNLASAEGNEIKLLNMIFVKEIFDEICQS